MKPKAVSNTFRISVNNAKAEDVFAYLSDLTRHGEWNSGLRVEALTPGPVKAGSQYHSWGATLNQKDRFNKVEVIEYQPPTRFAFVSQDPNFGEITHEFTVGSQDGAAVVERKVTAHMTPFAEFMWRLFIWPTVDRPGMNRSMATLKTKFEHRSA